MGIKTDNSCLGDKLALRVERSPWPEGRPLMVLDAFGGKGIIWAAVSRIAGKPVHRVGIDKRVDIADLHIHGDNEKVLSEIDLGCYDVVDLDAYGVPAEQIKLVLSSNFRGTVFVTAIQTMQGRIPNVVLRDIGIPIEAINSAPSLLARNFWEYFKEWLSLQGVGAIYSRSVHRKHYLAFNWPAERA